MKIKVFFDILPILQDMIYQISLILIDQEQLSFFLFLFLMYLKVVYTPYQNVKHLTVLSIWISSFVKIQSK